MKRLIIIMIILGLLASCKSSYYPKDGFVPNEETAIKIAEAVWLPVFGEEIYRQKPYNVKLKNSIWIVEGTLNSQPGEIVKGGVAYIEINRKDAKIKKVSHGL